MTDEVRNREKLIEHHLREACRLGGIEVHLRPPLDRLGQWHSSTWTIRDGFGPRFADSLDSDTPEELWALLSGLVGRAKILGLCPAIEQRYEELTPGQEPVPHTAEHVDPRKVTA